MALRKLGLSLIVMALATAGANEACAQSLEDEQGAAESDEGDTGGLGSPSGTEPAGDGASGAGMAAPIDDEDPGLIGDEQAELEEEAAPEPTRSGIDPYEEADQDYFFLGVFYRQVIIPGFIQELFVDGGIDGFNPGVGLQFLWRKNNFNVSANVWWNNAQGQGFFRASGDPRTDTEFIDANLGVVFVNAEFMWSFPITDWFAIDLGFDLGVGFIYGDLVRTEAVESSPGAGDWRACDGPGGSGYCEPPAPEPCYANNGGHYDCNEPNWLTEGGDTPVVMPWVTLPHLAVRFKPIHQLQIRIDGGYGLYNFFFGGGVSYGF